MISLSLILNILLVLLLILVLLLLIEIIRTVIAARKVIQRVEMLSDVKEWLNFFRFFKKRKKT